MKKRISSWLASGLMIATIFASSPAFAAKKPNVESSRTPEVSGSRMQTEPSTSTKTRPGLSAPTLTVPSITQQTLTAPTLGSNLIQNNSVEDSTSTNLPTNWNKGGYGTNSRTFSYPVTGYNSTKAIKISIGSYTSGDAKWYFNDVPVTPGTTYQFSDYYISDVNSSIDVRYTMNDGTFKYGELVGTVVPSSAYQQVSTQFTIPANVKSLTIFHLISQTGNLTTDEYSLNQVGAITPPPPPPSSTSTNLILNSNFEQSGSNGLPASWGKGGYGTNARSFTYPATGVNGSKAAQVNISSYTGGDAKWYFNPIPVSAGSYTYQDDYISNIPSTITVQYQKTDGSFSYSDIAQLPSQSSFTHMSIDFSVPSGVKAVSVFHLIEGVGSLTIDNTSLSTSGAGGTTTPPQTNNVFNTGAISLRFDDGWLSQYQVALPKMQSAGYKGTFFIVSRQLEDYGFSGFMSKAQVKDLFNTGNEVGAHTQTHADLPTLNSTQQQQEIQGSRNDLLAMNIGPIISFAYPYGDYNSTTLNLVKSDGFNDAAATINGDVTPNSDRYQLERQSMESNVTIAQAKQWIDNAIANKEWLILTFHQIDTSGDQYSTTPAIFNAVVDYLKQKNAQVVTIGDAVKALP